MQFSMPGMQKHGWAILYHLANDDNKPLERLFGQIQVAKSADGGEGIQDLREYCARSVDGRALKIFACFAVLFCRSDIPSSCHELIQDVQRNV
jgi:hypothetical protein